MHGAGRPGYCGRVKVVALLAAIFAIAAMAEGTECPGSAPPKVPYEDHGACPFECCTYRTWRVKKDTELRTDRRDSARIAFRVRAGEQVEGITGVVVTTRLGKAAIRRPITVDSTALRLQSGEAVYILHYLGEGFWKVWTRGQFVDLELADRGQTCRDEQRKSSACDAQIVTEPVAVWWARIRNRAGQEGWTRQLDHFGNIDACG